MTTAEEFRKQVELACKLTTPELRRRRNTVIAVLKKQLIDKEELSNGFAYRFNGTDYMLDQLVDFIKTERLCCEFFDFRLTLSSDQTIWMELTGPEGSKEFIIAELTL